MKRILMVALTFTLFIGVGPFAPRVCVGERAVKPNNTPRTVSGEDLLKATKQLKDALRKAEDKATAQEQKNQAEYKRRQDELLQQFNEEKKLLREVSKTTVEQTQLQKEIEKAVALQQESQEREEVKTRNMIYWTVVSVLMVVFIFSLIVYIVLRKRRDIPSKFVQITPIPQKENLQERFVIHEKSDVYTFRQFVENDQTLNDLLRKNGTVEVLCVLELPKKDTQFDGQRFNCTAVLNNERNVFISFDEDTTGDKVTWKNRNVRASKIAMQQLERAMR